MNYKCEIEYNNKTYTFTGNDRTTVVVKVKIFCKKNNINYSDGMIERRITTDSPGSKPSKLTFSQVVTGAHAILRYTTGTSASDKEVTRRTDICLTCPHRSETAGCGPCGFGRRVANFINSLRAKKKTEAPIDAAIKQSYCDVCKCSIPMMVLTRYEDFYKEVSVKNNMRPDYCWLKESSPNFTNE